MMKNHIVAFLCGLVNSLLLNVPKYHCHRRLNVLTKIN